MKAETITVQLPNRRELEKLDVDPNDPTITRHLVERGTFISVLRRDQLRLTRDIAALMDETDDIKQEKKTILERQLDGLQARLRNAIVLDFS